MQHEIIARVWDDPAFREALLTMPEVALTEYGYRPDPQVRLICHADDAGAAHLVVPMGGDDDDPASVAALGEGLAQLHDAMRATPALWEDPRAATAALSGEVAPGIALHLHRDEETVHHVVLPVRPAMEELSEHHRHAIAGSMLSPKPGR